MQRVFQREGILINKPGAVYLAGLIEEFITEVSRKSVRYKGKRKYATEADVKYAAGLI